MRTLTSLSVTASWLMTALFIGCSQAENKIEPPKPTVAPTQTAAALISGAAASTPASTTATPVVSNAAAPPVSGGRNLPPEGGDKPTAAEFDGYPYSYKKDGEKTVATFSPKLLPWDRDIVAGAVRDVVYRSYGDRVDSDPYMKGTGSAQTIRVAGTKHQYVVVPTREPTGEIHSLIITQLK